MPENTIRSKDQIRKSLQHVRKIESDNPAVEISKLNHESVAKLADDANDIFSVLYKDSLIDESFDYALAVTFAKKPLQGLERRLNRRGFSREVERKIDDLVIVEEQPIQIEVGLFVNFLKEFLVRRHCINGGRVRDYIEALDKASGRDTFLTPDMGSRPNILKRLG